MNKPDAIGSALLQARHLLNEAEGQDGPYEWQKNMWEAKDFKDMIVPGGHVVLKIHPMCWGLFKATLLKAMKHRDDLKAWSPELFTEDKICGDCKGEGRIVHEPGSKEHARLYEHFHTFNGKLDADAPSEKEPIRCPCRTCQSTGVLTKGDQNAAVQRAFDSSEQARPEVVGSEHSAGETASP